MNIIHVINAAVVAIGIPLIIKAFLSIGWKLKTLDNIENDMQVNIKPDLKDIRERFGIVEDRVATLLRKQ